jgi:23S rRNA pseudouridine2605 synthase
MRLSKILAQAGLASRRGAEALLGAGRVTVNGTVRLEPGAQADPATDVIALDGQPVGAREAHAYVMLHKPRGYVTSLHDPEGRKVVTDLLPQGAPRLFPVGRLDYDAEGLLLLTNDGELTNRLLHPRYGIPRVYEVEVERHVGPSELERWRRGALLPDGPALPSAVRILKRGKGSTWLSVTFREGRYREVKRYCKALGHPVRRLRRVQFGPLHLGTLPLGRSRALDAAELGALRNLRGQAPSPILGRIRR